MARARGDTKIYSVEPEVCLFCLFARRGRGAPRIKSQTTSKISFGLSSRCVITALCVIATTNRTSIHPFPLVTFSLKKPPRRCTEYRRHRKTRHSEYPYWDLNRGRYHANRARSHCANRARTGMDSGLLNEASP